MRASLIVIVLFTSILCPLAEHASADSGDLTIVSQQEFVIYEEQEIQAWLTLNNRGTEQRSFTISAPNLHLRSPRGFAEHRLAATLDEGRRPLRGCS